MHRGLDGIEVWLVGYRRTSKGFFTSCDDDCADAFIIVIVAQSFVELLEEWCTEGVEGLRAVQGDCSRWSALMSWVICFHWLHTQTNTGLGGRGEDVLIATGS